MVGEGSKPETLQLMGRSTVEPLELTQSQVEAQIETIRTRITEIVASTEGSSQKLIRIAEIIQEESGNFGRESSLAIDRIEGILINLCRDLIVNVITEPLVSDVQAGIPQVMELIADAGVLVPLELLNDIQAIALVQINLLENESRYNALLRARENRLITNREYFNQLRKDAIRLWEREGAEITARLPREITLTGQTTQDLISLSDQLTKLRKAGRLTILEEAAARLSFGNEISGWILESEVFVIDNRSQRVDIGLVIGAYVAALDLGFEPFEGNIFRERFALKVEQTLRDLYKRGKLDDYVKMGLRTALNQLIINSLIPEEVGILLSAWVDERFGTQPGELSQTVEQPVVEKLP